MNGNASAIVHQIFKVDSIDEVALNRIESICEQYPFFSASHYLLSKKLHKEKADHFLEETKKTALYFQNPFWLQWLLQNETTEKKMEAPIQTETEEISTTTTSIENSQPLVTPIEAAPVSIEDTQPTPIEAASVSVEEVSSTPLEPIEIKEEPKKEVIQPKEEEFIFNAYHTVDYFASLGIKLSLEDLQQDKLGKQLRSFTDWLKTMKKLPQKTTTEPVSDANMQTAVEGYAALSIQQKEIITEAMADVLAKQGKNENAIELYRKLSLLNPGKSAYFAAKIEQINEH
ncbi:MAG: hypothetical protein JST58_14295 [Bacteroidetes bacterium]|jgi:hypothetical protein|nr:hypothetical protein [Bacteroidota bacterium]